MNKFHGNEVDQSTTTDENWSLFYELLICVQLNFEINTRLRNYIYLYV
jgi:hypothetical protein